MLSREKVTKDVNRVMRSVSNQFTDIEYSIMDDKEREERMDQI